MKKIYILIPMLLLICLPAFAKVYRVGYNGIPLKGVDYPTITEVNDSVAKNGDTIQIYGSQSGTINKRLVILGFGYNLKSHPGLQSNPGILSNETNNPSNVNITLEVGSDSTIIEGCQLTAYINSNKVIIRKCFGGYIILRSDLIAISDIKIISCINLYVYDARSYYGYQNKFPSKNIQVFNCIQGYLILNDAESTGSMINCNEAYVQSNTSTKILIKNCILSSYYNGNNIYDNNIFLTPEPIPTVSGANNKWSQNRDSIFVTPNPDPNIGSLDENNSQLRPNSPAKNFGIDLSGKSTDCGIFGGEQAYRYRIGGQPAIPTFYKLSVPSNSASTNPYNITISVRSNN